MTVRTTVASRSENAGREANRRLKGARHDIRGIQPRPPMRASPFCSAPCRFLSTPPLRPHAPAINPSFVPTACEPRPARFRRRAAVGRHELRQPPRAGGDRTGTERRRLRDKRREGRRLSAAERSRFAQAGGREARHCHFSPRRGDACSSIEPEGEGTERRRWRTAKVANGEDAERRRCRMAKMPNGEDAARRRCRTAKMPNAETAKRRRSLFSILGSFDLSHLRRSPVSVSGSLGVRWSRCSVVGVRQSRCSVVSVFGSLTSTRCSSPAACFTAKRWRARRRSSTCRLERGTW